MGTFPPIDLLARPGQPLREHLTNVADLAEAFAARFGAGQWGRALGLLHDMGKASTKFQRRVRGDDIRVDHSTAGARYAAANWAGAGKLLAYCIAGHHAGLPDGHSNDEGSLEHRLDTKRRSIEDSAAWSGCLGPENQPAPPGFDCCPFATTGDKLGFRLAFFLRMLFSCLVDADRLDAEAAGDAQSLERAASRSGYPGIEKLLARLETFLVSKTAQAKPTTVNRIRAEVLAQCRAAAKLPPGLFSLTVPTGGGKTLSSLAFALEHARLHNLERIIYVIPFTSIIEQNAKVFREALDDPNGDIVIEHHSNLVPAGGEDDDRPHPATENWDAPIIVTTAVQFFESLFAARAGRCRKLHNLAKSVIVLDEAQMLPLPYLRPCVESLRELAASYGASVVLCTATQPALNAPSGAGEGLKDGLTGVREIVADPLALHQALKRVQVRRLGRLTDAALAERLASERQVLCIVPTRRMARELFEALRAASPQVGGAGAAASGEASGEAVSQIVNTASSTAINTAINTANGGANDGVAAGATREVFHLSALMCPQHRTETLGLIRAALAENRPCRVVSTTLVEAGVDLDFPVVYRAEAGLDSIAQAAGRCNREGKRESGAVFVFEPEAGLPPGVFRRSAQAGQSVAQRHEVDLLHPDAVHDYFLELYWRTGLKDLDAKEIVPRTGAAAADCLFPFREIERDFQLIDTPTQGLIIPCDDTARELVRRLQALEPGQRAGGLFRRLQRHTVSLYARDFARLEQAGAIGPVSSIGPGAQVYELANMGLYDPQLGLDLHRAAPGVHAPEDLVC